MIGLILMAVLATLNWSFVIFLNEYSTILNWIAAIGCTICAILIIIKFRKELF
jgi:hypothetical protein